MWHWGISVKTMPQKILAVRSFLRRGLFCVVGRQKRKRPSDVPTGLLLCDYGYPAKRLCGGERLVRQKRGAEMIWNKHRTLFIRVRIDLVARLIITLTLTSEGEISWCYRSNQTSLVKRLHSATYFLHFTKRNMNFRVTFFRPPKSKITVSE